ncbi:MarR family winged helix-turn-helix transcriptional regulator [Naasia lichenicola]|nr:MarR family transcriptional regulator [Naasia lichenicola]
MPSETPQRDGRRMHPATQMIREILDVSAEFEGHLGRELSVNPTDLAAMEHLIQSGPLAPSELARRLHITPPAVTASVDRLEAVGHVLRTHDAGDRRRIVITASQASTAQAMGVLMPMIRDVDRVIESFDADQQAAITRYLDQVLVAYRSHIPSDGSA